MIFKNIKKYIKLINLFGIRYNLYKTIHDFMTAVFTFDDYHVINALLPYLISDWNNLLNLFFLTKNWHHYITEFLTAYGNYKFSEKNKNRSTEVILKIDNNVNDRYYFLLGIGVFRSLIKNRLQIRAHNRILRLFASLNVNHFTVLPNRILHGVSCYKLYDYNLDSIYFLAGKIVRIKHYCRNDQFYEQIANIKQQHKTSDLLGKIFGRLNYSHSIINKISPKIEQKLNLDYIDITFYPAFKVGKLENGAWDSLDIVENLPDITQFLEILNINAEDIL